MLNLALLAIASVLCSLCGAIAGFALASGNVAVGLLALVGLVAVVRTCAALIGARVDRHARDVRLAWRAAWVAAGGVDPHARTGIVRY